MCGGVSSNLPSAAQRLVVSNQRVELEVARRQQREYVEVSARPVPSSDRSGYITDIAVTRPFPDQVLKQLVKEVHVIPVDDRYPDCVFVEDPVVACGDTALLPILGKG